MTLAELEASENLERPPKVCGNNGVCLFDKGCVCGNIVRAEEWEKRQHEYD
jgi:hypothetical protein